MSDHHFSLSLWLVPLWSAAVLVLTAGWLRAQLRLRSWVISALLLAAVAVIPLLPAIAAPRLADPPTQVIYRFDDHRQLELQGWQCEGALWYVDTQKQIRTEVASKFYQIVFFKYIHPSERYIAIPWDDMSAVLVSRDGGRTFGQDARISVSDISRYKGHMPTADEVSRFIVADDRGYIETKDGRVIQSSLPIGDYWGLNYIDYLYPGDKMTMNYYESPEFQDMKKVVPDVRNYTGWTHMQCDPNAGIVPKKTSLEGIPGLIYSAEVYTIAAPVYFGLRAYQRYGSENGS